MSTYEAHITIPAHHRAIVDALLRLEHNQGSDFAQWKTSVMTDDPVLGPGRFAYLTRTSDDLVMLTAKLGIVRRYLTSKDVDVLRMKIELEVYDWRKPT